MTAGAGARAARARQLQTSTPAAAELLAFYAALVDYQQQLSGDFGDAAWVGRAARDFVDWLIQVRPNREYDAMRDVPEQEWRELFTSLRADPEDAAARFSETSLFVIEAVVQPSAERAATEHLADPVPSDPAHGARCPFCGGAPVVGVLREEGHGARRRLVCGLCCTEWDYLRVVCVKCGEQRFEALPVFTAEQFPHARIDACDTCRSYLKTIDATKDGRAIPIVDDLATTALDLWAREQGYTRVRANLLRV